MAVHPASLLAQLVEFGHAPRPTRPLPPEWQVAYDAVRFTHGTRQDRMEAFAHATESSPNAYVLMVDLLEAMQRDPGPLPPEPQPITSFPRPHPLYPQFGRSHTDVLNFLASNGPATTPQLARFMAHSSRSKPITPDRTRRIAGDLKLSGLIARGDGNIPGRTALYHITKKGRDYLGSN